jgi:hypothetical protein
MNSMIKINYRLILLGLLTILNLHKGLFIRIIKAKKLLY